jgi:type I restriction enzyme M protein
LLEPATAQRIRRAQNALMRKILDSKSQVEQIAIALLYKCLEGLLSRTGRSTLQNQPPRGYLAPKTWAELTKAPPSDEERVQQYYANLREIADCADVPPVISRIFRNAQMTVADPGGLAKFLEVMEEFNEGDIKQLDQASEYLFSLIGFHRQAGRLRTPDWIQEFIVSVVNPQRGESILDPACGTAGFLVSAYRHTLQTSSTRSSHQEDVQAQFWGYDSSPEMVRLSLLRMVLQRLENPQIIEHDVLASCKRWGQCFDVILANPSFMPPSGENGFHSRFPVATRRPDLLFLQYIVSHLRANGRAGIVVPEGILFQTRDAYQSVRKLLVNNGLIAIVSLPAGCFKPYSEARTSILFLDKGLARSTETIIFFPTQEGISCLPRARGSEICSEFADIHIELIRYLNAVRSNSPLEDCSLRTGRLVRKAEICSDDEFNLNYRKYCHVHHRPSSYPDRPLGEVAEFLNFRREPIRRVDRNPGPHPYYGATGAVDHIDRYLFDEPLVLVGEDGGKWGAGESTAYCVSGKYWVNNHAHILRPHRDLVLDRYLVEVLNQMDLSPYIAGTTVFKLNQERLKNIRIPLPSIQRQQQIVKKIEGYEEAMAQTRQSMAGIEQELQQFRQRTWGV